MTADWIGNFRAQPATKLSNERYASMAAAYDRTCHHILPLRALAVEMLDPRPGEIVADIACGTGQATLALARHAGRSAQVIGFEQSPDMLGIAEQRRRDEALDNVRFECTPIATASLPTPANALLMSYTHDVLQDPVAIQALVGLARPGARYVLLGMRTLPWLWGWPVNLFVTWRARRYLTTVSGLSRPWHLLESVSQDFRLLGAWHAGTSYLATGRFKDTASMQASAEPELESAGQGAQP